MLSLTRHVTAMAMACAILAATSAQEAPPKNELTDTVIHLTEAPVLVGAKRMGLNLGGPETFAAGQYMKNILQNPGFESGEYGMVFHVDSNGAGDRFPQDFWSTDWNNDALGIGQPVGFWNGADYEIVYGSAAGRTGKISNFTLEGGKYVWYPDSNGAAPDTWSVVFVRQQFSNSFGTRTASVNADTTTKRPGSSGVQCFHATYPGAPWQSVWSTYFDSYWRDSEFEAGKMLVVRGNWRVEFWAKGKNNGDEMRVRFYREGEGSFVDRTFPITSQWQKYTFDTFVPEGADKLGPYTTIQYHPIIGLTFHVVTPGSEIWLDDAQVFCTDSSNPTAFTDTFVNRLKELRPGVLRDWRVQFGASLDNELSDQFARKMTGWRPHERKATTWGYSLHEFLQLCEEVGAEPWYSIPPTFTPAELQNLAAYLCAPVSSGNPYALKRAAQGQSEPWSKVFSKIHLEFGNELWGAASGTDPFFGASLLGGVRLGRIANARFAILRTGPGFDAAKLDLIIGGQNGAPGRQTEIMSESTNHDDIAIAPYFGTLDNWNSDEEIYYPLFARAVLTSQTKAYQSKLNIDAFNRGTTMSIYEVNYHTTGGPAPTAIRNQFVAGASGALALPLTMLSFQRDLGVNAQCAFSAAGFGYNYGNSSYVRLWGLLRDIEGTRRKRPTWLGLEMVNKGIFGDMVQTSHSGVIPTQTVPAVNGLTAVTVLPMIHSFAYRDGFDHSAVLFNLDLDSAHTVELDHAQRPQGSAKLYQFAPADIKLTNETAQLLDYATTNLTDFSDSYVMSLPPRSLSVLTWSTKTGLNATPQSLTFPDTEIQSTADSSITITNEANTIGPRDILGVVPLSGDPSAFQMMTAVPINGIAPNSTVSLQFRFAPTTNGLKAVTYLVSTTDPDFPTFTITLQGTGTGDDDGDGVPESQDAFPWNPNDWNDTDGDGLGDNFENLIITAAQTDGNPSNDYIQSYAEVTPEDDFDGDGFINLSEFLYRTDPTDGTTSLPTGRPLLLAVALALCVWRAARRHTARE